MYYHKQNLYILIHQNIVETYFRGIQNIATAGEAAVRFSGKKYIKNDFSYAARHFIPNYHAKVKSGLSSSWRPKLVSIALFVDSYVYSSCFPTWKACQAACVFTETGSARNKT